MSEKGFEGVGTDVFGTGPWRKGLRSCSEALGFAQVMSEKGFEGVLEDVFAAGPWRKGFRSLFEDEFCL